MAETTLTPVYAALDDAWSSLHPELPEVVFTIGAGRKGRRSRNGSFSPCSWQSIDGDQVHEIFLAGERLNDGAPPTVNTLLHEAAHALAHVRDVQDTSRQGRYHNKRFVGVAEELGMEYKWDKPDKVIGWSDVLLTDPLRYADTITSIHEAIRVAIPAIPVGGAPRPIRRQRKFACGCGTETTLSAKLLDEWDEPVVACIKCEKQFAEVY